MALTPPYPSASDSAGFYRADIVRYTNLFIHLFTYLHSQLLT